jgi:ribosome recycling factor
MQDDVLKELEDALEKAHSSLKRELARIRTGRANAAMLDGIKADYYGTKTPLPQMATVSVPEPRMLTVKPWDKGVLQVLDKAIRESDLGLNPQLDGDTIRVPIPVLSEERRKDLVKVVKKIGEECRVSIRKARHEAIDVLHGLKKDGDASEDEVERAKKKVEEAVSVSTQAVSEQVTLKEKEIMQV